MARRKIIVIGILCVILSTFGYFLIRNKNSFEKSLTDFECKGIIENIEQRKNHGIYYFFINGGWQYFGTYGDYVNHFAVVGDSLVKEKGKSELKIYKVNSRGEFKEYKTIRLSIYPLQSLD